MAQLEKEKKLASHRKCKAILYRKEPERAPRLVSQTPNSHVSSRDVQSIYPSYDTPLPGS
jgi:hypothetical protein